MSPLSRELNESTTIKSVTLADLEFGRPSPFDRIAGIAKMTLILWGALSFGAAAGAAAYFIGGSDDDTRARMEAVAVTPDEKADPKLAEIPPHLSDYVSGDAAGKDAPVTAARLPRPRPDEPIHTGSIGMAEAAHGREYGPCEALADLGASFAFRVRCARETRVYAPAPARPYYYYYPQPYTPPYYVR